MKEIKINDLFTNKDKEITTIINNINIELLPIFTDKRSDINNRIKQIKSGVEKIVDKYGKKAHIISYSLSGIDARGYISQYNGDININTLLTISTPNK